MSLLSAMASGGRDFFQGFENISKERAQTGAKQEVKKAFARAVSSVENPEALRAMISAIPGWMIKDSAALAAGMLHVPKGAFKNRLVEGIYNTALEAAIGAGQGLGELSDEWKADPKTAMLRAIDEQVSSGRGPSGNKPFDHVIKLHHHPDIHKAVKDSKGNWLPACDKVGGLMTLIMDSIGRGKWDTSSYGVHMTADEAAASGFSVCPHCLATASADKGEADKKGEDKPKSLDEQLTPKHWRVIIEVGNTISTFPKRFNAKERTTFDSDDDYAGWRTTPFGALDTACDDYVKALEWDDSVEAKIREAKRVIHAVDFAGKGKPTFWAQVTDSLKTGDLSSLWHLVWAVNIGATSLAAFIVACFFFFVLGLISFWIGGAMFGYLYPLVAGAVVVYLSLLILSPVEWIVSGVSWLVMELWSKVSDNEPPDFQDMLKSIGRDLALVHVVYGPLFGLVIWWELPYVVRLLLLTSIGYMIAQRYLWKQHGFFDKIRRSGELQGRAMGYIGGLVLAAAILSPAYYYWPESTVWQPLLAQENGEVITVSTQYKQIPAEKVFGKEHVARKLVEVEATDNPAGGRVLAPVGSVVTLPGYTVRKVEVPGTDKVAYEYSKSGWSDWYGEEEEVGGSSDGKDEKPAREKKFSELSSVGGLAYMFDLNYNYRTDPAAGTRVYLLLLVVMGIASFVVANVRGTGIGAAAARFVSGLAGLFAGGLLPVLILVAGLQYVYSFFEDDGQGDIAEQQEDKADGSKDKSVAKDSKKSEPAKTASTDASSRRNPSSSVRTAANRPAAPPAARPLTKEEQAREAKRREICTTRVLSPSQRLALKCDE